MKHKELKNFINVRHILQVVHRHTTSMAEIHSKGAYIYICKGRSSMPAMHATRTFQCAAVNAMRYFVNCVWTNARSRLNLPICQPLLPMSGISKLLLMQQGQLQRETTSPWDPPIQLCGTHWSSYVGPPGQIMWDPPTKLCRLVGPT